MKDMLRLKRTIRLDEIPHQVEYDEATRTWLIRIPASEINRRLMTPNSCLYNVRLEWGYDEIEEKERWKNDNS